MRKPRQATVAVRAGIESDQEYHAVVPPIYLSSTYGFSKLGEVPKYDYARSGNPTRDTLGQALADLEGGAGGVVTNCGTSAINLLVSSLLSSDDLLIAPHDCYGGTYRLFDTRAKKGDFKVLFVDQNDEVALADAFSKNPKLIWIETPSNPLLRLVDVTRLSQQAHRVDCHVAVDNTFLSPIFQQPLSLGADFVVHSTTKYLNGHSDVLGGVVISKTEAAHELLSWWGNCIGATGGSFDSYLMLRGLRTLVPRMNMHESNAQAIVAYLKDSPFVNTLYHPSLPNHPNYALAVKQQMGFGGMISFEFAGSELQLNEFVQRLSCFSLAESLGGTESLIAHPASMTHRAMSDEAQIAAGISPFLLRLSVGLEDPMDLINDLKQAFEGI